MHEPPPEEIRRLHDVVDAVAAPAALRAAVGERRASRAARARRRGGLAGALAVAAVAAIAVVLATTGGGAPSLLDAAALAARPPAAAPPAVDASDPRVLRASVGGVRFPAWGRAAHWVPSGRRSDRVGGREATTVFYDGDDGTRLGYTIVSGDALAWPHGDRVVVRDGVAVHLLRDGGRRVVAWRVAGHSCVISAPASVPESRLVELASGATYGPV